MESTSCSVDNQITMDQAENKQQKQNHSGAILLGAGLAFASLILLPALAQRIGMGGILAGASRIALMRASSKVANGSSTGGESTSTGFSCH